MKSRCILWKKTQEALKQQIQNKIKQINGKIRDLSSETEEMLKSSISLLYKADELKDKINQSQKTD
ncbi:MAG: hypothetical protein NW226_26145 [Microscillaceae bacterium]|nr:hypothetical protein [Microscillaceae bacterium]